MSMSRLGGFLLCSRPPSSLLLMMDLNAGGLATEADVKRVHVLEASLSKVRLSELPELLSYSIYFPLVLG